MRTTAGFLVLVVELLLASGASAQAADSAAPSLLRPDVSRVRIVFPRPTFWRMENDLLTGQLVGITADSLYVRPHERGGVVAIPRDAGALYVSRGRSRWRSALTLALLSAALWVSIHGVSEDLEFTDKDNHGRIAQLAGTGAAAGFLMGVAFPMERWKRVR